MNIIARMAASANGTNGNGRPPRKERVKREKWYPDDPANSVSCNITDTRRIALDRLAYRNNTTVGSLVRAAIEEYCAGELNEIEKSL